MPSPVTLVLRFSKPVLSAARAAVEGDRAAITLLLAIAFALTAITFAGATPAHAAGPTVTDGGVENHFPDTILFKVHAESTTQIERIRLLYKVLPDGTNARGEADFDPGTSVDATFELQGNNPPEIYLPPGTVIEYSWEVTDADGNVAETDRQSFFYDDNRFQWQKIEGDGLTVYYYSGSVDDAQGMHDTGVEALAAQEALLGAEVPFEVQVWAYDNRDDMLPALQRRSAAYEAQIITAGVRVASNTVLVLGNASFDTLRHELTHVVTKQAGESAFGTLPAWLDEGTAVHGQLDPGGFQDAIEQAVRQDNLLSVRSISAYPGDPAYVEIFYGQGWSLVSYLVDTYGQEMFAQLFAEIKGGKRIGSALEATYGFDEEGLDNEWRDANGLPPRETPAPTPTGGESPSASPTTSEGDGGGTSTAVIIAIAAGVLLLAGLVGAGGIMLARKV